MPPRTPEEKRYLEDVKRALARALVDGPRPVEAAEREAEAVPPPPGTPKGRVRGLVSEARRSMEEEHALFREPGSPPRLALTPAGRAAWLGSG